MDTLFYSVLILLLGFCEGHKPVHEEINEESTDNTKVVKRTPNTTNQPFKSQGPPVFQYQLATQQDQQRSRYAQQQRIDVISLQKSPKNPALYQFDKLVTYNEKIVDNRANHDRLAKQNLAQNWNLVDPKALQRVRDLAKTNAEGREKEEIAVENEDTLKTSQTNQDEIIWEPIPLLERIPDLKENSKNRTKSEVIRSTNRRLQFHLKNESAEDLDTESSENIGHSLRKIKQGPNGSSKTNKVTRQEEQYVHPNTLRQDYSLTSILTDVKNSTSQTSLSESDLAALNDLLGKNPSDQLQGLQELLKTSQNQFAAPVVNGPRPFVTNKPVVENTIETPKESSQEILRKVVPNLQIDYQQPDLIKIQEQLDVSSEIQAKEVLAKAQQQAQAHVEAQHKAIQIAQQQAVQHAIEQAAQNGAIISPQQLHQVQQPNNYQQQPNNYQQQPNNYQPEALPLTNKLEVQVTSPSSAVNHVENVNSNLILVTPHPYRNRNVQVVQKPELLVPYGQKNNHQAIALLQAERALLAQVQAQNHAILQANARKHYQIQPKLHYEQNAQTIQEEIPVKFEEVPAYHYDVPKRKIYPLKKIEEDEELPLDNSDGQYASQYAFGYRIKDYHHSNDFGHEETREGKETKGHYHVLLPDGRLQKVEYYADSTGYHAKVVYEDLAKH